MSDGPWVCDQHGYLTTVPLDEQRFLHLGGLGILEELGFREPLPNAFLFMSECHSDQQRGLLCLVELGECVELQVVDGMCLTLCIVESTTGVLQQLAHQCCRVRRCDLHIGLLQLKHEFTFKFQVRIHCRLWHRNLHVLNHRIGDIREPVGAAQRDGDVTDPLLDAGLRVVPVDDPLAVFKHRILRMEP